MRVFQLFPGEKEKQRNPLNRETISTWLTTEGLQRQPQPDVSGTSWANFSIGFVLHKQFSAPSFCLFTEKFAQYGSSYRSGLREYIFWEAAIGVKTASRIGEQGQGNMHCGAHVCWKRQLKSPGGSSEQG